MLHQFLQLQFGLEATFEVLHKILQKQMELCAKFYKTKPIIKNFDFSILFTKFLYDEHDWTLKISESYEYVLNTYA